MRPRQCFIGDAPKNSIETQQTKDRQPKQAVPPSTISNSSRAPDLLTKSSQ